MNNGENYLSDSNYCLFSNNLELMDVYVYDNNCKTYGVGIDGMYVDIPMPFRKGDIVTLGRDINGVYLGYHPEKPEDYKPGHSYGDILFYGIYAEECGFDGGYVIVFNYNVEYKDPSLLSDDDLKLIPLSKYLKGELDSDEFYRNVRILELKFVKNFAGTEIRAFCMPVVDAFHKLIFQKPACFIRHCRFVQSAGDGAG